MFAAGTVPWRAGLCSLAPRHEHRQLHHPRPPGSASGFAPSVPGQGLLHHSQTEGFVKACDELQRRIETPVFLLAGIKDTGTIDPHATDHELITSWTQKLISLCSAVLHNWVHSAFI